MNSILQPEIKFPVETKISFSNSITAQVLYYLLSSKVVRSMSHLHTTII